VKFCQNVKKKEKKEKKTLKIFCYNNPILPEKIAKFGAWIANGNKVYGKAFPIIHHNIPTTSTLILHKPSLLTQIVVFSCSFSWAHHNKTIIFQ